MSQKWLQAVAQISAATALVALPARAELISASPSILQLLPGATAPAMFELEESQVPLLGYSLELELVPLLGATGTVSVETATTNFYDPRNLITAGGLVRDPDFSVILPTPTGGVFINTITEIGSVMATPSVNDALAQVYFTASPDAAGDFQVILTDATALADEFGSPVEYDFTGAVIHLIPEPTGTLILASIVLLFARRERR